MRARERVNRVRVLLSATAVVSAVLWAFATSLVAMVPLSRVWFELPRALAWFLLLEAPLIGGGFALWRSRRVWSRESTALWLEERTPTLRYALVTASEVSGATNANELERLVETARFGSPLARATVAALVRPMLAIAVLWVVGARLVAVYAPTPASSRALPEPLAVGSRDRLTPLGAAVTPPVYSGLPRRTLVDPSSIPGLVASRVTVEGRGAVSGIRAELSGASLRVENDGAGWRVRFAMPARATALSLTDRDRRRLVILEPLPDSAPVVTLLAPAHDTVLRAPAGTIAVTADARDDFGLADAWLEYIVSSGEGENFTFRSGVLVRLDARGERTAVVAGTLRLEALALRPGDVIHVRAVARDRNDATGPDTGVSETRTIRIARRGEYDSVAVEGAPAPDVDKSVISERMLILLAEDLQRRRAALARDAFAEESRAIARDQARLRRDVSRVIFARLGANAEGEESQGTEGGPTGRLTPDELLRAADSATAAAGGVLDFEGDETPVVAVNRPLLEAYNAMWDAGRRLEIAEPGDALPYMRAALDAIQRARAAERLYLRGRTPPLVVDLAQVRLAGSRADAAGAARSPRAALDSSAALRVRRLDAALARLPLQAGAVVDSLLLLRVDAIAQDPALAAALGAAIEALRAGRDATAALARARRIAVGAPIAEPDDARWEGAR